MPTIGNLNTSLTLESSSFVVGLKKAVQQTQTSVAAIEANFNKLKVAAEAAAAALALDAAIGAAGRALDYASSLGEVAQQLGVTTKDLQIYRFAATQVGVEQAEMDKGLQKLTRSLGEARDGAKKPAAAFRELGQLIGRDIVRDSRTAGDAIPLVAEALGKIADPARRARLEVDLFGKTGQQLDTLLAAGRGQIDELRGAAERLGIVLSDKLIQQADDAADKLAAMKQVLEAKLATTVAANADAIVSLADGVLKLSMAITDFLGRDPQRAAAIMGALAGARIGSAFGLPGAALGAIGGGALAYGMTPEGQAQRAARRDDDINVLTRSIASRQARLRELATPDSRRDVAERARLLRGLQFDQAALSRMRNAQLNETVFADAGGGLASKDFIAAYTKPVTFGGGASGKSKSGGAARAADDPFAHLQQQIRDTVDRIGVTPVELGNIQFTLDKDSSSALRLLSDKYGVNLTASGSTLGEAQRLAEEYLANMRAADQQLAEERRQLEERLASERETTVRSLATIYQDAFRGGTKAVWRDFRQIGLQTVAEVLARFTIARITGQKFDLGGAFGTALSAAGFGGFRAGGGPVDAGKAYVVGEKRAEIFVPRVPGSIIPQVGGGGTVVQHNYDLRGALVDKDVYADMQRIAASTVAQAAPALVNAAQMKTMDALQRPRL